jgi:flagellar motor switch protein FliG
MPQDLDLDFGAALPMAFDPAPMGGMEPAGGGLPAPVGGDSPPAPLPPANISSKAKAAIIVRLLLNEGADIPIEELPDELQLELTQQMGRMRLVDRGTLHSVAAEFADQLDNVGLAFTKGLAGALNTMEGKISRHTASRLRKEAGVRQFGNPWERLKDLPPEELAELAEAESTEVAAVLLSKLDTAKAAKMLAFLPGPVARRITYAVSHTSAVSPETVDRIGLSLAAQVDARPDIEFAQTPGQRVGAILTEANAAKREEVLTALDEEDQAFAKDVRKSIFTFALIHKRIDPKDVPGILRTVPQPDLVTSNAFAKDEDDVASVNFILENISARMASNLREEAADAGTIKSAEGEESMSIVMRFIRDMISNGDLTLLDPDEAAEDG